MLSILMLGLWIYMLDFFVVPKLTGECYMQATRARTLGASPSPTLVSRPCIECIGIRVVLFLDEH